MSKQAMTTTKRRILAIVAIVAATLGSITVAAWSSCNQHRAVGFQSGGTVLTGGGGGGGLSKVTTNSPGLLAGSGTTGNPLTATLTVTGPLSGTGSSGNALTSSGDISGVTAGSGLSGGGTTGAVTIDIGAGSGLSMGADTLSTNIGSGLTYNSGAIITSAGSGLTYSSGSLITNAGSGLTYNSGALITSVGTGLTYSSGAIVPNLAGGTCVNGQAHTALSSTGTATCGNVGFNRYETTHRDFIDEWMFSGVPATGANAGSIWTCTSTGTQASCNTQGANTAYAAARFGILEIGTGNTATGTAGFMTTTNQISFDIGNWTMEFTGGWEVLSTGTQGYAALIGFFDTAGSIDQVDGCYFLYDERGVAAAPTTGAGNAAGTNKLACVCAANSVRTEYVMDGAVVSDTSFTTVNAPVAALATPNTNFKTLQVVMTTASEADFYVNGVLSCKITTHIPTGANRFTAAAFKMFKSVGTTTSTMEIDRTRVAIDLTSAISP